jgi:hypothetical protein
LKLNEISLHKSNINFNNFKLELLSEYSHPELLPEDLNVRFDIENNQAYVMMATKRTGEIRLGWAGLC